MLQILTFCTVLPGSTASYEGGLGCYNRPKTAYRNSLTTETLEDLLRISIKRLILIEFDLIAAIDKWCFSAERQHYKNMKYKKYMNFFFDDF